LFFFSFLDLFIYFLRCSVITRVTSSSVVGVIVVYKFNLLPLIRLVLL